MHQDLPDRVNRTEVSKEGLQVKLDQDLEQCIWDSNTPESSLCKVTSCPCVHVSEGASWARTFHAKAREVPVWSEMVTVSLSRRFSVSPSPHGVRGTQK